MLRNIVLGLLLANILVFTWNRWVVPRDAAYPDRLGKVSEPQLVLLSDGSSPEVSVVSDSLTGDKDRCTRIGPFADVEVADSVARQLNIQTVRLLLMRPNVPVVICVIRSARSEL